MKKLLFCLCILLGFASLQAQEVIQEPERLERADSEGNAPESPPEPGNGFEQGTGEWVWDSAIQDYVWVAYDDVDPTAEAPEELAAEPEPEEEAEEEPQKKRFRFKNRMVELSFGVKAQFSNDVVSAAEILQETAKVNLDNAFDGFKFDAALGVKPFSFAFNWHDKWGFGIDTNVSASGNVSVSENILVLTEPHDIGAGAAAFFELGIPVFFHVRDFKVKVRPAGYLPLVYTEPRIKYTSKNVTNPAGNEGVRMALDYDVAVYSPVPIQGIVDGKMEISAMLRDFDATAIGYDLGLGVEYPLYSWLDVGADITNLPFIKSTLTHYMQIEGSGYIDTSYIDLADMLGGNDLPEDAIHMPDDFKPVYLKGNLDVYRPFKMLFYANYRPFETPILTVIPSLGFSISRLYMQKGAVEAGVKARCDLANIFITTIGIGYEDRAWRNSLDFALNLRAFELDIGLASQSQSFVKSWQGGGLTVNVGIKFGW
ncbi:MAG: hypothetical protein LBD18_03900 [Treponema sp.]|jgi:hypothetical protein|nr:hypothetical protein [Treponema sp.]